MFQQLNCFWRRRGVSLLDKIQHQIKDKFLCEVSRGVQHFPCPQVVEKCHAIQNCRQCSLASVRKRVVVEKKLSPQKFFILSHFPDQDDENSTDVFSKTSPTSSILLRLVEKLAIGEMSHFSYALKCHPGAFLAKEALKTCVVQNLSLEFLEVRPKVVLCFGYWALFSLLFLSKDPHQALNIEPNSHISNFVIGKSSVELYFLPSLQDLKNFPHWRKQVWDILLCFKEKIVV